MIREINKIHETVLFDVASKLQAKFSIEADGEVDDILNTTEKKFKRSARDLIINKSTEFKHILTEVCNPFNRVNLIYSFVPNIIYRDVPYTDIYEYSDGYSNPIQLTIDEKPDNINIEHVIPVSFFMDQSNKELKKDTFLYETYYIIYHYIQINKFNIETIDENMKSYMTSKQNLRKKVSNKTKIKSTDGYQDVMDNYYNLKMYYDHYQCNIKEFKKFFCDIGFLRHIKDTGESLEQYITQATTDYTVECKASKKNLSDKIKKLNSPQDSNSSQDSDSLMLVSKKQKRREAKQQKKYDRKLKKLSKGINSKNNIVDKINNYRSGTKMTQDEKIKHILKMCEKLVEIEDTIKSYSSDFNQFSKILDIAKEEIDDNISHIDLDKVNLEKSLLEVVVSLLETNKNIKTNEDLLVLLNRKIKQLDNKYSDDLYGYELMKSDLHHVFASSSNVNSTRSNYMFDEIDDRADNIVVSDRTGTTDDDIKNVCNRNLSKFNPVDNSKGDIARAICYFDTTYPGYDIVNFDGKTTESTAIELETMVIWNFHDNSTYREKKRNYQVYMVQHNYNPFTHYPDLLPMIYYDKLPDKFTRKFGNTDVTWSKKHFNDRINSFIDNMWDIIIGFNEMIN